LRSARVEGSKAGGGEELEELGEDSRLDLVVVVVEISIGVDILSMKENGEMDDEGRRLHSTWKRVSNSSDLFSFTRRLSESIVVIKENVSTRAHESTEMNNRQNRKKKKLNSQAPTLRNESVAPSSIEHTLEWTPMTY
jgi:hypothetical protein